MTGALPFSSSPVHFPSHVGTPFGPLAPFPSLTAFKDDMAFSLLHLLRVEVIFHEKYEITPLPSSPLGGTHGSFSNFPYEASYTGGEVPFFPVSEGKGTDSPPRPSPPGLTLYDLRGATLGPLSPSIIFLPTCFF